MPPRRRPHVGPLRRSQRIANRNNAPPAPPPPQPPVRHRRRVANGAERAFSVIRFYNSDREIRNLHENRHPSYGSWDDIQRRDDDWWDATGDYIQFLFPLPEPSTHIIHENPNAPHIIPPTVNGHTLHYFTNAHRIRMLLAYSEMLEFFGMERDMSTRPYRIIPSVGRSEVRNLLAARRRLRWNQDANPHQYAITRMIRSLRIFSLPADAAGFAFGMWYYGRNVNAVTRDFWRRAHESPLDGWEGAPSQGFLARIDERGRPQTFQDYLDSIEPRRPWPPIPDDEDDEENEEDSEYGDEGGQIKEEDADDGGDIEEEEQVENEEENNDDEDEGMGGDNKVEDVEIKEEEQEEERPRRGRGDAGRRR